MFIKVVQNLLSEREWTPGIDAALKELPEDIRFGIMQGDPSNTDPNAPDPSALQAKGGDPASSGATGPNGSGPVLRAANDRAMVEGDL